MVRRWYFLTSGVQWTQILFVSECSDGVARSDEFEGESQTVVDTPERRSESPLVTRTDYDRSSGAWCRHPPFAMPLRSGPVRSPFLTTPQDPPLSPFQMTLSNL